jgi:hypothetical protein
MQAQTKGGALSAETFLASLAAQAKRDSIAVLVSLAEAGERLSWRCTRAEFSLRYPAEAKMAPKAARAAIREVLADIDRNTKGASYRFDTPSGPVFEWDALFEAAGRSGGHEGGPDNPHEPTWPSVQQEFLRTASRAYAVAAA